MKPSLVPIALVLAVLGAPVATAAPKQDRRATAAALFEQGIKDMQAGKTSQGCDELAESVATLPDSGAKGALAECDTALGRLSDAWELWRDLASSAPTAELRNDAARNAAALELRLARVALHVRGAAPAELVVTLNGKPVSPGAVTEHRVDPGTLVVVATSPDTDPWTRTFKAQEAAAIEIEIPLVLSRDVVRRHQRGRLIGLSLVGAGAVALGVGAVFGGVAYSDWHSATDSCGGTTDHCKTAGFTSAQSNLDRARTAASISTWTVGAGSLAVATGLIVYFSLRDAAPSAESASAWRASPLAGSQTLGIMLSRSLP
jgi:hypothetical protein